MEIISNLPTTYKSNSHFVYRCLYHVIFCPKYRRPVLIHPINDRLKTLMINICKEVNSDIIEVEVMEDHVHAIISCDPSFGINKVICKLKGKSAKILRDEFPELKSKLPCLWTRSTFVSTVGSVSLEIVKKYIEDQRGQ